MLHHNRAGELSKKSVLSKTSRVDKREILLCRLIEYLHLDIKFQTLFQQRGHLQLKQETSEEL